MMMQLKNFASINLYTIDAKITCVIKKPVNNTKASEAKVKRPNTADQEIDESDFRFSISKSLIFVNCDSKRSL